MRRHENGPPAVTRAEDMSSRGPVNNTAPQVTQRAKRAYRNQLRQLQTAGFAHQSGLVHAGSCASRSSGYA
jgi:hypothetical protein